MGFLDSLEKLMDDVEEFTGDSDHIKSFKEWSVKRIAPLPLNDEYRSILLELMLECYTMGTGVKREGKVIDVDVTAE